MYHFYYYRTSSNLPVNESDSDSEEELETSLEYETDISNSSQSEDKASSKSTQDKSLTQSASKTLKRKRDSNDPVDNKIIDSSRERRNDMMKSRDVEPRDADMLFLMSLLPSLKNLDDMTKSLVKIKMQQIIFDAEFPPQIPGLAQPYQITAPPQIHHTAVSHSYQSSNVYSQGPQQQQHQHYGQQTNRGFRISQY